MSKYTIYDAMAEMDDKERQDFVYGTKQDRFEGLIAGVFVILTMFGLFWAVGALLLSLV